MLEALNYADMDAFINEVVPENIRFKKALNIPEGKDEATALKRLQQLASSNSIRRNYIGQGYYACQIPTPILRNVLENPQWYTPYTPYQPEISQGRLEALLNFQTVVCDLTGLPVANASMLDEATAAAEAMTLCLRMLKRNEKKNTFWIDENCHPQTINVIKTRALPLGINLAFGNSQAAEIPEDCFGVFIQYPDTYGEISDPRDIISKAKTHGARVVMATDLLALTLLKEPSAWGVDIAVGSAQRFGMPLGYGGPHAAFMACTDACRRQMPGRIIGISIDKEENPAFRLSLQTREQHIRRDKATSNICTAQALPAIVSSFYAVYHGPAQLKQMAININALTNTLATALKEQGYTVTNENFFDTLSIELSEDARQDLAAKAEKKGLNLRYHSKGISLSIDETTSPSDLETLIQIFIPDYRLKQIQEVKIEALFKRDTDFLQQEIFNSIHSETELMRYMDRLQKKDIGLTDSMIPLGSCTMKLNAATEMIPVTLSGFSDIHPFAPEEQVSGYRELFNELENWLAEITGFDAVSLQPNAGSQGEYAGLMAIRSYHESRGDKQRDICLIPMSAHGTNPASAAMAGMKIVGILCDTEGNIDVEDLKAKAQEHSENLSALMITYPSTHGVFEETIITICQIIHDQGGQVYLDGANMNAMVGLSRPADLGADVCHLNLHKTFCIPHGGGGPGMGPIGVVEHLKPFLPGNPIDSDGVNAVSASDASSGCILPISYSYILLMGPDGLKDASETAILNANYLALRLSPHYDILYRGKSGRVAHECIIDCRNFKASAGIEVEDIAKRLIDFGFHAPTMSWPVPGTLMIEPTESENLAELDRFCEALIQIKEEIARIEKGQLPQDNNMLKWAPHTASVLCASEWPYSYNREEAAYPLPWVKDKKYWPPVSRVDNVFGDRNLVCTCPSMSDFS